MTQASPFCATMDAMRRWIAVSLTTIVLLAAWQSASHGQTSTTSTTRQTTTTTRPTTTTSSTTSTTASTTTTSSTTTTTAPTTTSSTTTTTITPEEIAAKANPGDKGWWWLLLLLVPLAALLVWLATRKKHTPQPHDERWQAQATQLLGDLDAVSHPLVAGADASGPVPTEQWAGVLSRSREVRDLAGTVASTAPTVELHDAVMSAANLLRSLELDADAARLGATSAAAAVQTDSDRVRNAVQRLRQMVVPQTTA
jgi:hypothetical protein